MIIDSITHWQKYNSLHPLFLELNPLLGHLCEGLPDFPVDFFQKYSNEFFCGKRNLGSSGIFYNVDEYYSRTAETGFIESHRKFIDVQIVLMGRERIGYASTKSLQMREAYDDSRDLIKWEGKVSFFSMLPGYFMLLWPDDAHQPQVVFAEDNLNKEIVKKMVVKIPME